MKTINLKWDKSGLYFIGLVLFVFLGFWPSYFAKFFDGSANFNFYFHFHALMAGSWVTLLVIQPILIKIKKLALHKLIGKLSYVLLPLFPISVILLKHSRIGGEISPKMGARLWIQVKDLVIIGIMYAIAIINKKTFLIHARVMVAIGIVFIEPSLGRFIDWAFFPEGGIVGYMVTIGLVYSLLITLIIIERKQAKGRWIFPLVFVLYLLFHWLLLFQISFPIWDAFVKWFFLLTLT